MTEPRATITLRMPKSLRDRLAKIARAEGVSLNQWMTRELAREAERKGKQ